RPRSTRAGGCATRTRRRRSRRSRASWSRGPRPLPPRRRPRWRLDAGARAPPPSPPSRHHAGTMEELPLIELPTEQTERADAASNRRRILAAATELFATRGAACVSMQDVARAAGVGMGTMYRRFGDRAGLTFALLGERHRAFQEQLLRGAPPLGPG